VDTLTNFAESEMTALPGGLLLVVGTRRPCRRASDARALRMEERIANNGVPFARSDDTGG
jgi:hypothetical protein